MVALSLDCEQPKHGQETRASAEGDRYSRLLSQMSVTGLSMGLIKPETLDDDSTKITFGQAVMTMILNCVGTGILFFPKVMADVGVVAAPLLCLLCAAVCLEAGTLISFLCSMAEDFTGVQITSYEELALFVGGVKMQRLLVVTKNFAFLGYLVVFIGLVSDSVAKFFPQPAPPDPFPSSTMTFIRFGIVFPMFALLAMLKNLKQLARFAPIGIFAMVAECLLLMAGCYLVGRGAEDCLAGERGENCRWFAIAPPTDTISAAFPPMGKATSIFFYSYAMIATVPSFRSQLKEPSQMPKVLSTSFGFCAVLNISIMSMAYWAFGGEVPDNQNDGISLYYPLISQGVAIAIIINLLLSAPLLSYCVISVFEATGTDALRTPLTLPNIGFRAGLMLALATTTHFLPYTLEVTGLVSSIFACTNNLFFPVIFFYLARKVVNLQADVEMQAKTTGVSIATVAQHAIIMLVGLCMLVFGVQGSLNTLLEKIAESNS